MPTAKSSPKLTKNKNICQCNIKRQCKIPKESINEEDYSYQKAKVLDDLVKDQLNNLTIIDLDDLYHPRDFISPTQSYYTLINNDIDDAISKLEKLEIIEEHPLKH